MAVKHRVAFQGEHGAFSELAAKHFFGKSMVASPVKTFDDVFKAVLRRSVDAGIVPVENSLYGSIHQTYDLLRKHSLNIIGELKLRIVHALMANRGVTLRDVNFIYSHPQALGQCESFLNRLKNCEIVAVYDTAGAAKMIKEERRTDAAAIASLEAARVYGLNVLKRGIESDHRNFTRFLILSRKKIIATAGAKTSIIFSMKDIPGALFKALSVFALRGINLHKIESRPIVGKPWEYLFYLDFQGTIRDEACRKALGHLREIASYLKILGSYPAGKTIGGSGQ
ncbi:MAG TPA: prephenate dehydratase [Bacteroidota bacterium]|jgi:prephenate dehydratase|nr:prephenate dehydratase [Bacteroidota bacterium]